MRNSRNRLPFDLLGRVRALAGCAGSVVRGPSSCRETIIAALCLGLVSTSVHAENWSVDVSEDKDGRQTIAFHNLHDGDLFELRPRFWYGSEIAGFHQRGDLLVVLLPATSTAHNMLVANSRTREAVEELGFHPTLPPTGDRIVYEKFFPRFMPTQVPICAEVLEVRLGADLTPRRLFPDSELIDAADDPCDCRAALPVTWKPDGTGMAFLYTCAAPGDEESIHRSWMLLEFRFSHTEPVSESAAFAWRLRPVEAGEGARFREYSDDSSIHWDEKGKPYVKRGDGSVLKPLKPHDCDADLEAR